MLRGIILAIVSSMAACARIASDCTCGEVWRAAWQTDRLSWDAERSRLESELAALRKQLNVEGLGLDSTHSTTLQLGSRQVASLKLRTLLQVDPQCSIAELLAVQAAASPVATVTAMLTTNF